MNTILILDKDAKTGLSEDLKERILRILKEKAHRVEVVELGRNDVTPCFGCFLCLTKHPGICVTRDRIAEIRNNVNRYDMTIFLTPVIFGHFSSTVKCAIDRGCGSNNIQVMVGYGDEIDDEEKSTFIDLIRKHCGKADIVHPGLVKQADVYLTTSSEDSDAICEAFKKYV
ncbi:MAG TPA: NAD(P)H-dependent oxidoreductase [Candidatus Methanoperedens sp.]